MERPPSPAMRTASAQTILPVATFRGERGIRPTMRMGAVTFEGIAVTGRVLRVLELVLLLIIAILPG